MSLASGEGNQPHGRYRVAAFDVGVFLPTMTTRGGSPGNVMAAARHAEDLGFESVWVVDQLIAGTGVPLLESTTALAAAAAVTTRVKLGLGVLILPLRPVAWVAKQAASLQHLSGDRLLLGVGAGGDRHGGSWAAVGVPRRERGRRTDQALRVLADLIAGKPARLGGQPDDPEIRLSPAATVPPIIVGGMSEAAVNRAAAYGDGWFLMPAPPGQVARLRARLAELAAGHGRPAPAITASTMTAIDGDPALPGNAALVRALSDPDGMFGMPADAVGSVLARGGPPAIARHLADVAAANGAGRVVVTVGAGDWFRQTELLAQARAALD
jgi:alkanesulfonate monooxygenase SsuD/methylene tetrahydromethanopterin reductase-like flavin-dependent oxidoreductase (luciferase family)